MSEELNQKMSQLTELLDQVKSSDKLSGILSMLTQNNDSKDDNSESKSSAISELGSKKTDDDSINIESLLRIKKILESSKQTNDPKINLLNSLKPFLGDKRKTSLAKCMKMLKMTSLTKHMDDLDIGFLKNGKL